MQSWQTNQWELFVGNVKFTGHKNGGWYKNDMFYVTYKKYNVWYEMVFIHNLN